MKVNKGNQQKNEVSFVILFPQTCISDFIWISLLSYKCTFGYKVKGNLIWKYIEKVSLPKTEHSLEEYFQTWNDESKVKRLHDWKIIEMSFQLYKYPQFLASPKPIPFECNTEN